VYCNLRTRQYDVPEEDLFSPSFLPSGCQHPEPIWMVRGGGEWGGVGLLVGRWGGGGEPMEEKYIQCRICFTLETWLSRRRVNWLLSHPLPRLPSAICLSFSVFLGVARSSLLTGDRMGRGRSQIIRRTIYHSILSGSTHLVDWLLYAETLLDCGVHRVCLYPHCPT
jgi:hypothetical protein